MMLDRTRFLTEREVEAILGLRRGWALRNRWRKQVPYLCMGLRGYGVPIDVRYRPQDVEPFIALFRFGEMG